ncbi:MAG: hypothetical protein ACJAYM_001012 [Flavobacteriales bacterium]|jgi:hypothetical protein
MSILTGAILTCITAIGQACVPDGITVSEACDWDSLNSVWETAVDVSVSINLSCALTEVCYSRAGDGAFDCIDVSGLNLTDGTVYHLSLPGAGVYQVWTATPSGTSTIEQISVNCYDETIDCNNPYAANFIAGGLNPGEAACIYDTYICDCAGTSHAMGVLTYLGDDELESETEGKSWNGSNVHFQCNVWGFDCGDAGINFDPYGVCSGNLPPNNGCSSPGCSPLTLGIQTAPCQVGPNGYESVILFNFGVSDGCTISELHYQVNSGSWNVIDFLPDGGFVNGDVFLLNNAIPNATYQCYIRTSSGAVSPYFSFQNGDLCSDSEDICDCDGNKWPEAFTSYIGNGTNNNGVIDQDGYFVNFDCPAWSHDCGDGSGSADPFNVCSGAIPPSRGCQTFNAGCTDDTACDFDPSALVDDGTCDYACQGCTDPSACNFDFGATLDNASCNYDCLGCIDPFACNFDQTASQDDGNCSYYCQGCTDSNACNYDPSATSDDGMCDFSCQGCTDNAACNFNPSATVNDGSCDYSCFGCTDNTACNFSATATSDNGSCDFTCLGCTNSSACNFDPGATIDDGGCSFGCLGCTDPTACNYSPVAFFNDQSCIFDCQGCTDPTACNYSTDATQEDGTCNYACLGCTDAAACNFNENASLDNGSCNFSAQFLQCNGACINDADNDGVCDELEVEGCTYSLACNFDPSASEENGTCNFTSCLGCTYADATNFDPTAIIDNGSCTYSEVPECIGDLNYDGLINVNDLILLLQIYGQTCE